MARKTNISRSVAFTRPFRRIGAWFRGIRVGVSDLNGVLASTPVVDYGVSVNNDSAMKLTAFYAGLRLISENIAALPKTVKVIKTGNLSADPDHRVNDLLETPNAYTNGFIFWQLMTTWIKGWGNAYALIRRDGEGNPVELHQLHPSSVSVVISNGRKWYRVTSSDPAFSHLNGTYPDYNMLHFMEMTLDGLVGVNTVVYNAMALGKALATEKFGAEFYAKGGNLKAVLETDGNLGDDAYETFLKHFNAASNFETPLLEFGIKYKQLSVNPVAAQLVQSETLSIQDIARMLNIPPHMLAEMTHATFSNIEHQDIQFVKYSLRPIIKKIETELRAKLFFSDERRTHKIKFSLEGLLRGDTAARSNYYHNAILDGYLTRNEVRDLEGYERADGLDDFLYPLNTGVVGKDNPDDNKEDNTDE